MEIKMLMLFTALILISPVISFAEDDPANNQEGSPEIKKEESKVKSAGAGTGDDEYGLYGSLILGVIWKTGKPSQLEVTDDNRIADDLNGNSDSSSEFEPLPMPELGYVFRSTGTEISVGGSKAYGSFGLTVAQPFEGIGKFSVSGSYGQEDVWEDPYLTDVKRKKTDSITLGAGLSWEGIFGTGFQIAYGFESVDVDDDDIGDRYQSLRRDGEIHTFDLGYVIPFNQRNILIPSISFRREEMDGDSNSSNRFGVGANYILTWKKINFNTSLSAGYKEFDETHPVYTKTRDEADYSITEFITFIEPFGFKGFSTHVLLSYSQTDSNIDFFDSSSMMLGLGVGYSF